ncbi:MAG: sulfite exporter TauE/SafE family protein [Burkholderiales bacterium]|nr:TSUP family transporter [Burkholderiales bacterium]MDE2290158.1 sulfite exporter TauE/SafE family protein [Burkholderiales bacterium]MDE2608485.1 sulfite exporter TauE/SafE family protein [Burkholderiales bacterium]
MVHGYFSEGALSASLQALHLPALLGIVAALLIGGMVKGVVSIGVPLVAMPILSHFLSVKQSVLLLSMPIILGNIPQALEGGKTWQATREIAAPLIGTVLGSVFGVTVLISLAPRHALAASGFVLIFAALLMLASPKLKFPPALEKPAGFVLGFGAAMMESMASVPGPLLAMYLIATGATGKVFTKRIAIILVVSIVTLIVVLGHGMHASGLDLLVSAAASIPVIAGIVLARPLRDKLPPLAFRVLVLLFVLGAAVQMVRKSGVL